MNKLTINISPHVFSPVDTRGLMKGVIKALLPAIAASLYFFRLQALGVILASVGGCVLAEFFFQKIRKKKIEINNYSALLTGPVHSRDALPARPSLEPAILQKRPQPPQWFPLH